MKVFRLTFLASFLICIFVFSACKKDEKTEKLKINLGVLLPLTGGGASVGESSAAALQLAVQDINLYYKNNGIDAELMISSQDTETDTAVALQKISMLKENGMQLIVGPFTSSNVSNVKNYADNNDLLVVSPASVSSSLAIVGDNVFRLLPNDLTQGEAMAAYLNYDDIEILLPIIRNDTWGNELLTATTQFFSSENGEVKDAVKYHAGTTDFSPFISSLKETLITVLDQYPDEQVGIYVLSYGEAISILKLASYDSIFNRVRWYGSSGFAENKNLTADTIVASFAVSRGIPCPTFGLDSAAIEIWQPLMDRLQNELGRKPEIFAFTTYDATWLAAETIRANNVPAEINTIKTTFTNEAANYFGATGNTTLNNEGDREYATYDFWGIRNGTTEYDWKVIAKFYNETDNLIRY